MWELVVSFFSMSSQLDVTSDDVGEEHPECECRKTGGRKRGEELQGWWVEAAGRTVGRGGGKKLKVRRQMRRKGRA